MRDITDENSFDTTLNTSELEDIVPDESFDLDVSLDS